MISIYVNKQFFFKNFIEKILTLFFNSKRKNLGPSSVLVNLIDGFNNHNIKFNVNPSIKNVYKVCLVISGIDNLKKCIYFKKNKKIKTLLAGPNLVTIPSEYNYIIFSKYIDKILVPSNWVKNIYISYKKKCKNISIWFSGIESSNFKNTSRKIVLIYLKNKNIYFDKCINYLTKKKINFKVIRYGFFSKQKYYELLKNTKILIYFSITESQGLAMQEAWSMNVPTLVYKYSLFIHEKKKFKGSSSPYLNNNCGFFFKDFEDFTIKFKKLNNKRLSPQKWLNENMSQDNSIKKLFEIINK